MHQVVKDQQGPTIMSGAFKHNINKILKQRMPVEIDSAKEIELHNKWKENNVKKHIPKEQLKEVQIDWKHSS